MGDCLCHIHIFSVGFPVACAAMHDPTIIHDE
jgi:hypothetical protein